MSGKWSFQLAIPPARIEAEVMRDYAVQLGVPEDRIIMEVHSLDTISNAYYVKAHVLIPKQWHRLIVVSSVDHIERSEYIFRQVLGPEYEMAFIASPLTLSDVELEPMRQKERRSLWGAKRLFQGIAPGDHEAIYHQVLERYIPGIGPDRTLAEQNITTLLAEYKQILEKIKKQSHDC